MRIQAKEAHPDIQQELDFSDPSDTDTDVEVPCTPFPDGTRCDVCLGQAVRFDA